MTNNTIQYIWVKKSRNSEKMLSTTELTRLLSSGFKKKLQTTSRGVIYWNNRYNVLKNITYPTRILNWNTLIVFPRLKYEFIKRYKKFEKCKHWNIYTFFAYADYESLVLYFCKRHEVVKYFCVYFFTVNICKYDSPPAFIADSSFQKVGNQFCNDFIN